MRASIARRFGERPARALEGARVPEVEVGPDPRLGRPAFRDATFLEATDERSPCGGAPTIGWASQSLRRRRERLESRLRELEVLQRGGQHPAAIAFTAPDLDADDIADLDDAPEQEAEDAEAHILDQATAARSIVELKAEIETLKALEASRSARAAAAPTPSGASPLACSARSSQRLAGRSRRHPPEPASSDGRRLRRGRSSCSSPSTGTRARGGLHEAVVRRRHAAGSRSAGRAATASRSPGHTSFAASGTVLPTARNSA